MMLIVIINNNNNYTPFLSFLFRQVSLKRGLHLLLQDHSYCNSAVRLLGLYLLLACIIRSPQEFLGCPAPRSLVTPWMTPFLTFTSLPEHFLDTLACHCRDHWGLVSLHCFLPPLRCSPSFSAGHRLSRTYSHSLLTVSSACRSPILYR